METACEPRLKLNGIKGIKRGPGKLALTGKNGN